ncbi:MAG TPA: metallophosphoesterase [Thermoprotei archaeon]|nr:metallophosphoesterase [Thermoprotei archaeon]
MKRRKITVIILTAIILAVLYPLIIEPNLIVSTTLIRIKSKKIPLSFNGFKIIQLSDLHFGEFHLSIREDIILNKVREVQPDLIVITGDIVSDPRGLKEAVSFIEKLASVAKVIVILGNWDHSSGYSESLVEKLSLCKNTTVLINTHIVLRRSREEVYVIGVDDPYTHRSDLNKSLKSIPAEAFKILLAHSPQIVGEASGKVDLILSGHTHGGQVVVPLIGPLFVPLPPDYKKYIHGLYYVNGTYLYVSRGIGTSILPIRLLAPPEITIIILERCQDSC